MWTWSGIGTRIFGVPCAEGTAQDDLDTLFSASVIARTMQAENLSLVAECSCSVSPTERTSAEQHFRAACSARNEAYETAYSSHTHPIASRCLTGLYFRCADSGPSWIFYQINTDHIGWTKHLLDNNTYSIFGQLSYATTHGSCKQMSRSGGMSHATIEYERMSHATHDSEYRQTDLVKCMNYQG